MPEIRMPTELAKSVDFVATWLMNAKANVTLNQDMVDLLADHHGKGTSTDDKILKSLLLLTAKPKASNDVH